MSRSIMRVLAERVGPSVRSALLALVGSPIRHGGRARLGLAGAVGCGRPAGIFVTVGPTRTAPDGERSKASAVSPSRAIAVMGAPMRSYRRRLTIPVGLWP